ncbi:dTDP-4-dehydrorhamnose reductase [Candidatus Uhrbacteria bacterium]|nr:dTDP-4-dehydrorhamnose reductase [Candidatus Uhrbacteria bacterium]
MEHKKIILVTGANGQLGSELQEISKRNTSYTFLFSEVFCSKNFCDYSILDITDENAVQSFFQDHVIDICINTAAYTAVDAAETHEEVARKVNVNGGENLARACKKHGALFVHMSTDFVFDGLQSVPYTEEDIPRPLNMYAQTKYESEQCALKECEQTIILRTAWLYSHFGKNFVKTILEKGKEQGKLSVVTDQIGTPTYAADLAEALLRIISVYDAADQEEKKTFYGVYHYTNEGVASWYDFAQAIIEYSDIACEITPVSSVEYLLPARRPAFSVLNKKKIRDRFGIVVPHWRESLKKCILKMNASS